MSSTDSQPYDVNFCLPVKELENDRIKITPFIPSKHADDYWEATKDHPELYIYLPFGPLASRADFIHIIQTRVQPTSTTIVFAVLDKTKSIDEPPLAGLVGLLNTSVEHLSTELGWLITLPAYQRTHVTTNAIGLVLTWCLDSPSAGGLGLRRVQYQSNAANAASIQKAESFGFRHELVQKYQRVINKPGTWDTTMFSMCWDDWAERRGKVQNLLERTG